MAIPGTTAALTEPTVGSLPPPNLFQRNIGGLVAQVTIEEDHEDEVIITEHPVEMGAQVNDHAYKLGSRVTVRVGWSNSPSAANQGLLVVPANIVGVTGAQATGNGSHVALVYAQCRALQIASMMTPIALITGKFSYQNMVIRRVRETTTVATENAAIITLELQEIIFVNTSVVTNIPSAANMSNPAQNAGVTPLGDKQLTPTPSASGALQ